MLSAPGASSISLALQSKATCYVLLCLVRSPSSIENPRTLGFIVLSQERICNHLPDSFGLSLGAFCAFSSPLRVFAVAIRALKLKSSPYNYRSWNTSSWTTTDDRVRGGASQSFLTTVDGNRARFYGHLDFSTLGGAGFASQFSPLSETDHGGGWDLAAYDGVEIAYSAGDGRTYTLILKDELPDTKRDDGRERAGVNWEVDFVAQKTGEERSVWFPWSDFNATFRGKPKEDAGSLKKDAVKRVGIMMRSLFGKQEGDFSVELRYLCARKRPGTVVKADL